MNESAKRLSRLCSALDNPHRLKMLRMLVRASSPTPLKVLAIDLGIGLSTACLYTRMLVDANLITQIREGKNVFFRASAPAPLTEFLSVNQSPTRTCRLSTFLHALALPRRLELLLFLKSHPDSDINLIVDSTELPRQTAFRFLKTLSKAELLAPDSYNVSIIRREPESTLLAMAFDKSTHNPRQSVTPSNRYKL